MQNIRHARTASQVIDLTCIAAALVVAGVWRGRPEATGAEATYEIFAHVALFGVVWMLVASRLGTYSIAVARDRRRALTCLIEAWGTTWGIAGLVAVTTLPHPKLSIWLVLVIGMVLLAAVRLLLATASFAGGGRPRTLVVGASASARSLSTGKDARRSMEFVGFVPFEGDDLGEMSHLPRVGAVSQIRDALADNRCDLAMVCPTAQSRTGDIHEVFRACDESGLGVHYFPSFLDLEHLRVGLTWNENRQGLALHTLPNQSAAQLAKRAIDVAGAAVGLIAMLPVFVACAVATKLSSPGPVFFRQQRVGKSGEVFTCLKFRTMRVGAQAQQELLRAASVQDGPAFKIPNDPRVTSTGRFLRKFSLDELPQFLNVLVGDMSLVGPRPPIPSEVEKYTWWQRRRISVKPGLTCVWQVWGRNRVSFKRWVEMDLYYIDNWSLWLDIKLIAHTFRAVLSGTGT